MDKSVRSSNCPHVAVIGDNSWEDVIKQKRLQTVCERCVRTGPNLWLCLHDKCLYVGCGEHGEDCSTKHGQTENHHLTLNLTSMRIWCYRCECEVYKDNNIPPVVMRQKTGAITPLTPMPQPSMPERLGGPCHSRTHSPQPMEESSDEDDDMDKPRGLTGLQNIGNTCYMNAALQSLSNCPPLTRFFLDCGDIVKLVPPDRKPMMCRSFAKLLSEIWHKKRPAYVVPSSIASGIKMVHPMFRGYTQQDTQEFLRCFMDLIHEELKQPIIEENTDEEDEDSEELTAMESNSCGIDIERLSSQMSQTSTRNSKESDNEYETCDSGLTSERSSMENSVSSCCDEVTPENTTGDKSNVGTERTQTRTQSKEVSCAESNTSDMSNSVNDSEAKSTESNTCLSSPNGDSGEPNTSPLTDDAEGCKSEASENSYCPPVTRSAQKKKQQCGEQQSLGSVDSGIGRGSSDSSLQNPNAKSIKDTANIAQRHATTYVSSEPGVAQHREATGRSLRHVQSAESGIDTGGKPASPVRHSMSVNNVSSRPGTRSRQTSENAAGNPHMSAIQSSQSGLKQKKKKPTRYHSVISDVFDGRVLSSVQCLTCERVSTTKETFQDLSLPIPNKDHLQLIHNQPPTHALTQGQHKASCGEVNINQGWFTWMFGWMRSWFWGPTVKLQDCLAAFFSADELKGDNMYSCEKCKKLRNGVKFSRVLKLPEILCIHLKRFRHEFMFSTKISTHVTFPMDGLDMGPHLHKDCKDQVTHYDLVAVICHHGTAGGGHYTSYCLNYINETWYEFDDQYVTAVDIQTVENCEAYVLFYRKRNDDMLAKRKKASEINEGHENSFMKFFISRQWINKFNMFAEPGPISNHDFLCRHGGVHPHKWEYVNGLVMEVSQVMWEYLHQNYGGGPAVTHLYPCTTCKEEMDRLKQRQLFEKDTFIKMNEEFTRDECSGAIYAISISWFKEWESFVKDKTEDPPGPIDNSRICVVKGGVPLLKHHSDYGQISEEMWVFLQDIYGGGPELMYRPALKTEVQHGHREVEEANSEEYEN